MKPDLLKHLDQCPPFVVRRLARRDGRWLTADEIAKKSGLSWATVMRYSRLQSWARIPVTKAQAFAKACGHDLLRPKESLKYLAEAVQHKGGFAHLSKAARREFFKLLKDYR